MKKAEINKLKKLKTPQQINSLNGGTQLEYEFKNGYGASVACHSGSYGRESSLLELAVLKNANTKICYDTPITGDVVGWLTADEALELIEQIEALPDC